MNIEETIQFIVTQQAQNTADIHSLHGDILSLHESQREQSEKIDEVMERVDKLHDLVMKHQDYHIVTGEILARFSNWQEDHAERQDWLFDGFKKMAERQEWLEEGFKKLVEVQMRTESKVDKLAVKIDKFIDQVRKSATSGNGKRRKNGK